MMDECYGKNVLEELIELLKLEKIEENMYRGRNQDFGFKRVFGGQVLGQALFAASQTVPVERYAHSLHAYFMRPGDVTRPIVYTVDCIRNGHSFTTRRVVAVQDGQAIFSMSASFQIEETGFDHQIKMPDVPGPEGLESEVQRGRKVAHRFPPRVRQKFLCDRPIEIRQVDPVDLLAPVKRPPRRQLWFRAVGPLPEDRSLHRNMLAYASDFSLMGTNLYPHGHTVWEPEIQVASLDHAMWFHREFQMNDWLLYDLQSPSASRARALSIGNIFNKDGLLVATVTQEGLVRYRPTSDGG